MSELVQVFSPLGEQAPAMQLDELDVHAQERTQFRIGVVDNGKPNAGRLLGGIAEHLAKRLGTDYPIVHVSKWGDPGNAVRPLLDHKRLTVSENCNLVLYGSGD